MLAAVAGRNSGVGPVVEDVHRADSATLDCLTVLARAGRPGGGAGGGGLPGDEAPLAGHVADWLAQVRAASAQPCRCCSDGQFRPGCAGRAYQQFGTRVGQSFRRRSRRSYRRFRRVGPLLRLTSCDGSASGSRFLLAADRRAQDGRPCQHHPGQAGHRVPGDRCHAPAVTGRMSAAAGPEAAARSRFGSPAGPGSETAAEPGAGAGLRGSRAPAPPPRPR